MMLHVNDEPRSIPMSAEILARLEAIQTAHAALPRPPQAGRGITLRSRRAD